MNNIQRLAAEGGTNHRIFALTIITLMNSQDLYGRIYRNINEMDEENYKKAFDLIAEQNFHDTLDVVLWLEN